MKIFGKEINLNKEAKIIAVFLAVVMVVTIGTVAILGAPAQIKSITIDAGEHDIFMAYDDGYYNFLDPDEMSTITIDEKAYNIERKGNSITLTLPESGIFDQKFSINFLTTEDNIRAKISDDSNPPKITTKPFSDSSELIISNIPILYAKSSATSVTIKFYKAYDVTVTEGADVTIVNTEGISDKTVITSSGTTSVEENTGIILTAKVPIGYVLNAPGAVVAKIEKEDETYWYYTATIENVGKTLTIPLTASPKRIKVTVNNINGTGYVNPFHTESSTYKTELTYNSNFSFSISPEDGYNYPEVTYKIGSGLDRTIKTTTGLYSFNGLTDDTVIDIKNADLKEYRFSWEQPAGIESITAAVDGKPLSSGGNVSHGSTVVLTVNKNEAYSKSPLTVKANGVEISANEADVTAVSTATYNISVTDVTTVTVSGLTINTYTVTYQADSDPHYNTDLGLTTVTHGNKFTFNVTSETGYAAPTVTATMSGISTNLIQNNNDYTISNVTGDVVITISNGEQINYTVNCNVTSEWGSVVADVTLDPANGPYHYGDNVTITVVPKPGYTWNGTITATGSEVHTADGKTTITIQGNTTVNISGFTKQIYTVSLPSSITGVATNVSAYSQSVNYGDSCTFTVYLRQGYTLNGNLNAYVNDAANSIPVDFNSMNGVLTITVNNITGTGEIKFTNSAGVDTNIDQPIRLIQVTTSDDSLARVVDSNVQPTLNNATLTMASNVGYKITGANYSDSSVSIQNIILNSGINGVKTAEIPVHYSDITVNVVAEPITVTVTYNTIAPTIGNVSIDNNATVIPYTFNPLAAASSTFIAGATANFYPSLLDSSFMMTSALSDTSGLTNDHIGGGLLLDLDITKFNGGMFEEDATKTYFQRSMITVDNGFTVGGDVVTIPETASHDDIILSVTAEYTYTGGENDIPFITCTEQGSIVYDDEGGVIADFKWRALVDLNCGQILKNVLLSKNFKIEAYGFAVAKDGSLQAMTDDAIRTWARSSRSTLNVTDQGSNNYCYFYADNMSEQKVYTPGYISYISPATITKMHEPNGSPKRSGSFWFKVSIGNQTCVKVVKMSELDYDNKPMSYTSYFYFGYPEATIS